MKNFNPVRWQNFAINKDIKRIKRESSRTFWNKLQFISSIVVVCITIMLDGIVDDKVRVIVASSLLSVLVFIFLAPWFCQLYKRHRLATVSYRDSDLIRLFDEEIIYNVIIAYEFYKEKTNPNVINDKNLVDFYNIEQSYYYSKAIYDLKKLSLRLNELKKIITTNRLVNVKSLLNIMKNDVKMVVSDEVKRYADDLLN